MNSVRDLPLLLLLVLVLAIVFSSVSWAQSTAQSPCMKSFLQGLCGEWIGKCEQVAEHEEPDVKYFHAVIKQHEDGSYQGAFEFFRQDGGSLISCGETSVVTTFGSDGMAVSKIKGSGKVKVSDKYNDQRHELTETLSYTEDGSLQSKGTGKINISGMPLGLGKNGRVKESQSVWSIRDGMLSIDQKMSVSFKALVITKTVEVKTRYTARRGSDVKVLLCQESLATGALTKPGDAASSVD